MKKNSFLMTAIFLALAGSAYAQELPPPATIGQKIDSLSTSPAEAPLSEASRSDNLVRTISDLKLKTDILAEEEKYNEMLRKKNDGVLKSELDRMKTQEEIKNFGKPKVDASSASRMNNGVLAPASVVTIVRNIWNSGEKYVAEVYVGQTKDVISKGSVLITGERVVDITWNTVVLQDKKGKRKVIPVHGSATR